MNEVNLDLDNVEETPYIEFLKTEKNKGVPTSDALDLTI